LCLSKIALVAAASLRNKYKKGNHIDIDKTI